MLQHHLFVREVMRAGQFGAPQRVWRSDITAAGFVSQLVCQSTWTHSNSRNDFSSPVI
jgi:hypothetical protein